MAGGGVSRLTVKAPNIKHLNQRRFNRFDLEG